MKKEKNIEVEVRVLFDKLKYDELKKFLSEKAVDLGEDDKDVYFYLLPEKVIKVVNNISRQNAKIVIKLTRVGKGGHDTEEIEIPIDPEDFDNSNRLFSELEFEQVQHSFQKRHNYMYEDVEIALKYSDSWGYHMELEIMLSDKSDQIEAEQRLEAVAAKLGVRPMTPEEQKVFVNKVDKTYN